MLEVNQDLPMLGLGYNSIGRQGIFEVCKCLEMKKNVTLKRLDISSNFMPKEKKGHGELNELLERVRGRVRIWNY